jgi:hypothetical protein
MVCVTSDTAGFSGQLDGGTKHRLSISRCCLFLKWRDKSPLIDISLLFISEMERQNTADRYLAAVHF